MENEKNSRNINIMKKYHDRFPFCEKCGRRINTEVHHIIPIADGGDNSFENLMTLCDVCHREIHSVDRSKLTKIGIETARRAGKQIGGIAGKKLTTKKSIAAKEIIIKNNKDFNGNLSDKETMELIGKIARNTYYKYKKELKKESNNGKEKEEK